ISPAIAWLTIQKFIIFYCPLDGEHTTHVTSLSLIVFDYILFLENVNMFFASWISSRIPE
ncbi:hypothetical protein, partial [Blautia wexlerae]|uniref:hypothetical protein n=1 Tax=Blautia wexlerae TaxID=418240 RepID=UPI0019650D32